MLAVETRHQAGVGFKGKKSGKGEVRAKPEFVHKQIITRTKIVTTRTMPHCGPTIVDYADFDVQQDCEVLHKAMKGLGTDEASIINVIAMRSNQQRQEIMKQFAQMFGKDLIKELKSELGGKFEDVVIQMFKKPDEYDAWCLHDAMEGAGTTESTLIEIMCSRSNEEIKACKEAYKRLYKKDLAEELQSETSGNFKRLLYSLAQAARAEDDVDESKAIEDAQALLEAGEAQWGTDESRFNVVMASRSFAQLEQIMQQYSQISNKTLEEAIKSEMSGDIQDGMLAIVECAQNKRGYFAKCLYKSMKGLGTNDTALMRLMISRSEVDLEDVKRHFEMKYGKTLESFIEDDCSGDYKRILIRICRGNRH